MINTSAAYAALSEMVYSRHENDQPLEAGDVGYKKQDDDPYLVPDPDKDTGFYAETFEKDGRLVIVFRETDFNAPSDGDWDDGNYPLAGLGPLYRANPRAPQWLAAQRYVEQVRAANEGATIDFAVPGVATGPDPVAHTAPQYGLPGQARQ